MKLLCLYITFFLACTGPLWAQENVRYTYYDEAKKQIKEVYHLKSANSTILDGTYTSYHLNGKIEAKGQFVDNETAGPWEFYYENGALKMRGTLRQSSNFGLWEYFYENGKKSMEGNINKRQREGEWKLYYESGELREIGNYMANIREGQWKFYYEDGALKGSVDYIHDEGQMTEYYRSGKMLGQGLVKSNKKSAYWHYYNEESGKLISEGSYVEGKKNGTWKSYYPSGNIANQGMYINDEPSGDWLYYFEEGGLSMRGSFVGGQKQGAWASYYSGGAKKSDTKFDKDTGEYREYYKNGKIKVAGQIYNGKNEGKWEYYYESGKVEGVCDFVLGKGDYVGYYEDGTLQTKGSIEDDKRVGTWELYDRVGNLTGYYKPFYDSNTIAREVQYARRRQGNNQVKTGFNYFEPKPNEFKGVILSANPFISFLGYIPIGIEFFNDERLGHEFEFVSIRDPFFIPDTEMPLDEVFSRGYSIAIKQKFYNPLKNSQWYFGHEIRLTNLSHFSNINFSQIPNTRITASASEQRAEYGILLGWRLFQKPRSNSFTLDALAGYNVGIRNFQVDELFEPTFAGIEQSRLSSSLRFSLNFGYMLSFDRSRR